MTGLEQRRLDAKLSRAALALAAGVSRQSIEGIERKESNPHVATLGKLATYFDCAPSSLVREAPVHDEAPGPHLSVVPDLPPAA